MSGGGGMAGFDGAGLAVGSVRGLRGWSFSVEIKTRMIRTGPGFGFEASCDCVLRDRLQGAYGGFWDGGENVATCADMTAAFLLPASLRAELRTYGHGPVPDEHCGCGFWAYWEGPGRTLNAHVTGVIEGYGETLIGDRGFRCARARILALEVSLLRHGGLPHSCQVPPDMPARLKARYGVPVYEDREQMRADWPVPAGYPS